MKAIRVYEHGGPDVLKYEDCPDPQAGAGQIVIDVQATGINFVDVYNRTGIYGGNLPITPGNEAVGVVSAVGEGVTEFAPGDVIASADVRGSYAERAIVPASRAVKLPPGLDPKIAAASMLQGMTAHFLVHSCYPLKAGERCLIHAAAGGVGLLLVQLAKRQGAHVFATTSTVEKAQLVREAGADEVILYTQEDFEERVKNATDGQGVQVVYDSVGRTTFDKSMKSLMPRGYLVLFGHSSGTVAPVDPLALRPASLFLTRPNLYDYIRSRDDLLYRAGEVLGLAKSGELKVRVHQTFPLAQAGDAQAALESRATMGKVLLTP